MSDASAAAVAERLPSGRSVAVTVADGEERLVVRSPDGAVEVQVVFTPDGPVVRVAAARLEVACGSLDVTAGGAVNIKADEFRVKTQKSIHLNGETVRLNCTEDGTPPPVVQLATLPTRPELATGCCGGQGMGEVATPTEEN